jgi:WD40 repeat protein
MARIFVSYSRKDTKSAHKLVDALEEMGHDVWVDWEEISPAVDWLEKIKRGIEGADAFLFLVSPHSIKSEVCNVEIGHAALNNKRIVPVVLQDVKTNDTNEIIRKLNFTFLRRDDDYTLGLARIKDAIELDFEWVDEHSRLQTRALEWDRKKDTSLLLRGSDLRDARRAIFTAVNKEPLPTELQSIYITHSVQSERRNIFVWVVSAMTVLLLTALSFYAFDKRDEATANAKIAETNAKIAEENKALAEEQAQIAKENEQDANKQREVAEEQRKIAEDQKLIAQAQRSAARAQIYQIQPDELYTSTLLAVASRRTYPTDEADEILRKNISLLPIPVKQMHQEGGINSLEFNEQGDLFVTGGADGKACVWQSSDGEMVYCTTSPKSVNDAMFSPDGNFIVTGDASGEVQIIRTSDWSVLSSFNAGSIVWDIDVGNNGEDIAVTRDDGRITILDLNTGEKKYDLFVTGKIRIASFSPNGVYIAAGSDDGVITLWNLNRSGSPTTIGGHNGEVLALTFSPDNRYLVTGGADGDAVVIRTTDGRELYRLLHEDSVTDISFNPNGGSWFATVSNDRRVRLWRTTNGNEQLRMSQDSFVKAVDVSANGQWLATTGADKTVRVWNASTGTEMFQIPIMGEGTVIGFGDAGNSLVAGDKSGDINVWDISVMPAAENYLQFNDLVGDMLFSPSGEWLAASAGTRFWLLRPEQLSTQTATPAAALNIIVNGNITKLIFSPNSNWLGISTDAGHVLVYDLVNKIHDTIISSGVEHEIAFSPDSTHLFVNQTGGGVDAWNLRTREQTVAFAGGSEVVKSMAIGSSQIALGVENEIQILNESGDRIYSIESPGDHSLLVFNADGSMIASSNSKGFIEIWELKNDTPRSVGSIQKESVYSMSFNPAGTQLAVGTTNTVYLINPFTVKETARIPHAGIVTGVSYSADGNIIASASLKAIQFWDLTKVQFLNADDLVDAACSRLTANFSESQWSNLFGGEKYWVLCENLPVP